MIKTLFIEDESRGVSPYFRELQEKGFKCVLAKNGDEAMQYLHAFKFDLLAMDIMFPPSEHWGNDVRPIEAGMKLLQNIREGKIKNCEANIMVVVLTAVSAPEIEIKLKELGVKFYLKKPVDYKKVIDTFCSLKKNGGNLNVSQLHLPTN